MPEKTRPICEWADSDCHAAISLRASSLPLLFRCAASSLPVTIQINATNEAASNGTSMHEVLRTLPTTNRIDWDAIPQTALKHGAQPDEVRMLCAQATKLWNQVGDSFRGGMTEVSLEYEIAPGVMLTGHADIVAVSQTAMRVADWKGGRKAYDHTHQYKAYAAMALLASPDIEFVTTTGLWVRDCEIENYSMNRAQALEWVQELREVLAARNVYRPGSHCAHCPRNHECEAANALLRRDVAVIADRDLVGRVECELELMPDAEKLAIFKKADLVVKFAERVRAAIKNHVENHGDIEADGVRLTVTVETRRELDPLLAWPILEELGFADEDFARAMTLGVSKVEKVVAEKAGKGQGARAVRELGERLRNAGAVSTKTITKLQEKRSA